MIVDFQVITQFRPFLETVLHPWHAVASSRGCWSKLCFISHGGEENRWKCLLPVMSQDIFIDILLPG
jgi:hypothetical protein